MIAAVAEPIADNGVPITVQNRGAALQVNRVLLQLQGIAHVSNRDAAWMR